MPEEAKRLFFGNPTKAIDMTALPSGVRKCYGEPQPTPAKAPAVNPESTVLCYGNHSQQPQPDVPFQVVNNELQWPQKPKD